MALDLFFASILVALVALGAWRGAVASAASLFGLLAGYAAALFAATHLADWAAATLVVPGMLSAAVAGTLGFAVAWLVVSALGDLAIAWDRSRVEQDGRSRVDRSIGACVGLARGGLVVILLALLSSWLDAARDLGAIGGLGAVPDAQASRAVAASGEVLEKVVSNVLADTGPAGQVAARITARPSQSLQDVRLLVEDERLAQIFGDKVFWTLITNDSVDRAMNQAAMRSMVEDPDLRGRFADLGLVPEAARGDPAMFRQAMTEVLSEVAPRVDRLQRDPELNELAGNPEIIALVEAGDMIALMGHPDVRRLMERVSRD